MTRAIRVLIVDDHAILRSGLRMMLGSQRDIEVVGETGDLGEMLRLAQALAPDVITLDLSMPGGSSLGWIEKLRAAAPAARVVVLTMHDDPAFVRSALALGAAGYLAKSAADSALIGAIREVHRGRLFVDIADRQAATSLAAHGARVPDASPLSKLSVREREVLRLVALGNTNRAIAERLALSVKTVESYRARVMQKLGLGSRAELTRLAVEQGLLGAPPVEPPDGDESPPQG